MANIINITDKLSTEKPAIVIGNKTFTINDGMGTVMKFEEMLTNTTMSGLMEALKVALGDETVKDLDVTNMSFLNFQVLTVAILASMQGLSYEEADARFRKKNQS